MNHRTLLWLPVAVALPIFVAQLAMGPSEAQAVLVRVEIEVARTLWLLSCVAAVRAFERGDHLRLAWILIGVVATLLFLRDVLFLPGVRALLPDVGERLLRGCVVLVANLVQVAGMWILARAWSLADIDDSTTRSRGRWLLAVSMVVSIALTAGAIAHGVRAIASGDYLGLTDLGSSLGDAASFVLVGPLLGTALALRGGELAWSWTFLTLSLVAWMLFDGLRGIAAAIGLAEQALPFVVLLQTLGALYICSAALSQRNVAAVTEES